MPKIDQHIHSIDQSAIACAQTLAEAICAYLYKLDIASQALGMKVTAIAPDDVTVQMPVTETMVNGLHICHGGLITAVADTALAFASNSRNILSVVTHLSIDFLAPAHLHDTLSARATSVGASNKTRIIDVTVLNQNKMVVALLRGRTQYFPDKAVLPTSAS